MAEYTDAELAQADVYLDIRRANATKDTSYPESEAFEALPITCGNMI